MRQIDLVQELIGVESQKERIKIVKFHYQDLPKEKQQSLKKLYSVIRNTLYETESATKSIEKLRKLEVRMYGGSFSLTYQLAAVAARKPVITPKEEIRRMRKKNKESVIVSNLSPKDIARKVTTLYKNLTESELDYYRRFLPKAREAIDRNRTVSEAQQYLERRGDFPFSDGLFSINYQIACLASGEEVKTPQRELREKIRRTSYSNGKYKRLGAILSNTNRGDGHCGHGTSSALAPSY